MCGICGIAHPAQTGRTVDPERLARMRDAMVHRGPDDAGLWTSGGIGLGHRRLSIVDLARGHQPMTSADDALVIVYNGEVYNHPALRDELQREGVRYRTNCDTESVLHAYERFGAEAPTRLRGMFAFAIWDARRRELMLARDRFGVKPLYYAHTADGSLYFASEIKAILETGAVAPRLNEAMLPDYLANHATSGNETLYAGIHRLPAGHTLRWRDGEIRIEQYWDLPETAEGEWGGRSERDIVEEYRERLRAAVEMRLMADVPLGVFLSGGIDSAAIAATMSTLVREPISTFSVAFREREANELHYARIVAGAYRTNHHEVLVSPEEFFAALPRLVWHEDEPIAHPSSVALWFVSRLAEQHVKVVLTGEGSDETLAGYARYRKTVLNLRLGRAYERVTGAGLRGSVRGAIGRLPATLRPARLLSRSFLSLPATVEALYLENFSVFSRERQGGLLSPALRERLAGADPYAEARRLFDSRAGQTLLARLLYVDTKTYLHELLMKQDQMSMAASIESRVPFLDHPLVEWVASLPEAMKLRGGTTKYVLRRAMQGVLPPAILNRPKMGFPVPIGAWFRGQFAHVVDDLVLGERALARGLVDPAYVRQLVARHRAGEDHAERLWSLVNLELWQRVYLDGEAPARLDRAPAQLARTA